MARNSAERRIVLHCGRKLPVPINIDDNGDKHSTDRSSAEDDDLKSGSDNDDDDDDDNSTHHSGQEEIDLIHLGREELRERLTSEVSFCEAMV